LRLFREHETKKESGDNQPKFHHERLGAILLGGK
jgi:hypothetical protein